MAIVGGVHVDVEAIFNTLKNGSTEDGDYFYFLGDGLALEMHANLFHAIEKNGSSIVTTLTDYYANQYQVAPSNADVILDIVRQESLKNPTKYTYNYQRLE